MTDEQTPPPFELKLEEVRATAKAIVGEYGEDFVYNKSGSSSCFYTVIDFLELAKEEEGVEPDDPRLTVGCFVGTIFDRLGVPPEYYHGKELAVTSLIENSFMFSDVNEVPRGLTVDKDATANYLQTLQSAQDAGKSWGTAYDTAEHDLALSAETDEWR